MSSPTTHRYALTVKRAIYERWHVTEYWFVDTALSAMTIYRRPGESAHFGAPIHLDDPHDEVTTPLLPSLRVPMSTFFKRPAR